MYKDDELLEKIKKGNEKAFEELFRKYFIPLYNYAKFYTENYQVAEDMVQDVFFKIWQSSENITIHTSIKSYLYKSVHNNCIQYLRHLKVVQQHGKSYQVKLEEALIMNKFYFETGLKKLFETEIKEMVDDTVDKLPEKTRHIYIMSRKKNKSNKFISKTFNITEKAVEYHITKALYTLRNALKDYFTFFF